jgi:hypothetical protein
MAFNKYHSLFCGDLRLNSLANLGTMWFDPSWLVFRSLTIIVSCGLGPRGILLTDSIYSPIVLSLSRCSLVNLAQCGLALH